MTEKSYYCPYCGATTKAETAPSCQHGKAQVGMHKVRVIRGSMYMPSKDTRRKSMGSYE